MLTRPWEGEDTLQQQLQAWGANVSVIPLIAIQTKAFNLPPNMTEFDWIFFTSKNGVKAFYPQAIAQVPAIRDIPVAVVGPATGQAVQQAIGYPPQFVSPQFHAEGAAQAFIQNHPCAKKRILWPCGNLANAQLATGLSQAGASVAPLIVYETSERRITDAELDILQQSVDMLIFASPSAVQAYTHLALNLAQETAITCLGPKTAQAAIERIGRVSLQAESAMLEGLGEAIRKFYASPL